MTTESYGAIHFPATLTDSDNRIWTLQDAIPESAVVNFARYEHEGKPAYYLGGKTLHRVKFMELDGATACEPGAVIANAHLCDAERR